MGVVTLTVASRGGYGTEDVSFNGRYITSWTGYDGDGSPWIVEFYLSDKNTVISYTTNDRTMETSDLDAFLARAADNANALVDWRQPAREIAQAAGVPTSRFLDI